jgi:hypothetical protein
VPLVQDVVQRVPVGVAPWRGRRAADAPGGRDGEVEEGVEAAEDEGWDVKDESPVECVDKYVCDIIIGI